MLRPLPNGSTQTDCVRLTAEVSGGLDGAMRVISMLRVRRYDVLAVEVDLQAGSAGRSRMVCELDLEHQCIEMLLARLERMPAVIATQIKRRRALTQRTASMPPSM